MSSSVPIKLLNESQGHTITLELTSGASYRGRLIESEDNMNVQLKDVVVTHRDGKVEKKEQIFLRGSMIKFISVPDMLNYSPLLNKK